MSRNQGDKANDPLNIENWYNLVKEHTFETEFINVSEQEAKALVASYEDPVGKFKKYTPLHQELMKKLEEKLNGLIDPVVGAFIKMSSRSPKDAVFKLPNLVELIQTSKKNDKMGKNLCITHTFHQALRVMNGKEALFLLTKSQRVYHDLSSLLLECDKDHPFKLVLAVRKWFNIYAGFEFRGFVYHKKMNALSQYFETVHIPELVKTKEFVQGRIFALFDKIVGHLKELDNYVIDFCMLKDGKIMLVELNHFAPTTGTGLFTKDDYNGVFKTGPFEFRIHDKEDEKLGEKLSKVLSSMYDGTWVPPQEETEEKEKNKEKGKGLNVMYVGSMILILALLPWIINLYVKK